MKKSELEKQAKTLALALAAHCVRRTYLEDLHAGTIPDSKTGDYSDVKVVTPYGEIPWNQLSRLDNAEMKKLMKEVVNNLYSILIRMDNEVFMKNFIQLNGLITAAWDEPEDQAHMDRLSDSQGA